MMLPKRLTKRILIVAILILALPVGVFVFAAAKWSMMCGSDRPSCLEHRKAGCSVSGTYELRVGSRVVDATCDMNSDSGGWILVANYFHRATPKGRATVAASSERLPLEGSLDLGADEVGTRHWGHAGTSLLAALPFQEVRFKCQSSSHSRKADFVISSKRCLDYFRTGKGTCLGTPELREELARGTRLEFGHSATLPGNALKGWSDQGDNSITNYPFFLDWKAHWSVGAADNRWECDDVDAIAKGGGNTTYHQIWVR